MTLLTAAATIVAMWATLDPWPRIGWVTPNQHDADFVVAVEELKEFRDEWKCDEYDETLLELREELRRLEGEGEDTTEIEHTIQKIERAMEERNCSRFDDFG